MYYTSYLPIAYLSSKTHTFINRNQVIFLSGGGRSFFCLSKIQAGLNLTRWSSCLAGFSMKPKAICVQNQKAFTSKKPVFIHFNLTFNLSWFQLCLCSSWWNVCLKDLPLPASLPQLLKARFARHCTAGCESSLGHESHTSSLNCAGVWKNISAFGGGLLLQGWRTVCYSLIQQI